MSQIELGATIEGSLASLDPSDLAGGDEQAPTARLIPGSMLPGTRLKIVRWLGQGGMGVVFEVKHLDIERRYAAKLLNLARNPRRTRRFRSEARTISQLGSPYIVEVFDFKELPDGRLVFLMELLDGPSLSRDSLDDRAIALPRLIGLMRQACKGLHDAHEQGFVHRDVKPDNIMIRYGKSGREQVKLVDFGLASLRGKTSGRGGTPAYMSPEQCQGLDIDIRSDIYSLGVSLYELATGTLPFNGEDEASLRRQHLDHTAAPPSSCVEGGLPASLDALIMRCMAKDPSERYASAAELEAALIEVQLGERMRTPWDDLPAPALDDERRHNQLAQGLAQLLSRDRRRLARQRWMAAALVVLLAVAAVVAWRTRARARADEVAAGQAELLELRERARLAAAHARWVYPRVDDPDAETAYRVVLDIEDRALAAADLAGAELRQEFTSTLVGLGDTYWDASGGRGFAAEFYTQAVMFSPEHERARARSGLTPSDLLRLRNQAADADFEYYELDALRPLETLASSDAASRRTGLEQLVEAGGLSERQAANVSRLLRRPELLAAAPDPDPDPDPDLGLDLDDSADAGDTGESSDTGESGDTGDLDETGDGSDTSAPPESKPKTTSSKSTAKLVKSAKQAYEQGNNTEAEKLYRKALARNSRDIDVLVGLHRIHFDRGEYRKALDFAQRAAKVRPKQGKLHMYAGDSCMKVHDFSCARTHYKSANKLGVAQAAERLKLLDQQSGGG